MTSFSSVEELPEALASQEPGFVLRASRVQLRVKRAIDLALAGMLLVVLAPVLLLIAWLVKRDSPGPVFFRQCRFGMHKHEFAILKFRTMHQGASDEPHRDYIRETMTGRANSDRNGLYKLERPDDVTRFGRWLRRSSLDELPQLINVVRGDMSLVGPRPCIAYEMEHFEPHHHERFLVPAGMTGLWQVTGRGRATFREAVELDVAYARSFSIRQDLWILARTPFKVLKLDGTI